MTIDDASWSSPTPSGLAAQGSKPYKDNWSRDTTLFGTIMAMTSVALHMPFSLSANEKWIELDPATLIYVPDDDEVRIASYYFPLIYSHLRP